MTDAPARSGDQTSAIFTAAVTLELVAPLHFDRAFTAITQPCPWPKAYGGDLVAAAAAAAMRTVDDGKTLHSMHSYFMRPAEIGAEVRYEVEVLRDGRGYSTREVRGYQNEKVLYVCMANFAAGEPGDSFAARAPADVAPAASLPSAGSYLAERTGGRLTEAIRTYWAGGRGFDMRHVPNPVYVEVNGQAVPHQSVWIRPFDPLRPVAGLSDPQRDLAALAYVCDYTILEPILRVLGLPWAEPGLVTASLDHAMWFHRPVRFDGWLLYAQEALAVERGRGAALGRFFDAGGVHVATVLQEGMIRMTAPAGSDTAG
jgi:acyl-CoA thioesterase-2